VRIRDQRQPSDDLVDAIDCATWTVLTADQAGYRIEHRLESYSIAAVHRSIDAAHYPAADWLKSKFPVRSEAAGQP
jgi:hypothetical protein